MSTNYLHLKSNYNRKKPSSRGVGTIYTTPVWQCYEYGYAMSQYYGSAMSQ